MAPPGSRRPPKRWIERLLLRLSAGASRPEAAIAAANFDSGLLSFDLNAEVTLQSSTKRRQNLHPGISVQANFPSQRSVDRFQSLSQAVEDSQQKRSVRHADYAERLQRIGGLDSEHLAFAP
jgi:hypothetical protein